MNRILVTIITFLIGVFSISLQASPIDDALAAYKEKQYHKAANTILNSQVNLDELPAIDKLKISIMFINNASFHRDIASKAKKTQLIFLESLLTEQQKDKSLYIYLYIAELYIHNNQPEQANKHLDTFLSFDSINENYKNLAKVYKAWIALKNKNENEYHKIAKEISGTHLITDLALQFFRKIENYPLENMDKLTSEISKTFIVNNVGMSSRVGNYALALLVAEHSMESARAIYNRIPIHEPSQVEEITPVKIVNFYEPTLPESLYQFYLSYAQKLLSQIQKDEKLGDMAIFYLSEIDIIRNNHATAHEFTKKVKNLMRLPKTLGPLTEIRSSTHGYLDGKESRAHQVWDEAMDNDQKDPALMADAVLMCLLVNDVCPTLVQKGQLAAENGRSKRFEELSTNVGRYYLDKDLNDKAMRLMEYALDRSNMNSLLANEPLLLLNLAESYRANKKYSKSLQVYFSLGQNFPVMRQIQDAVQGEYLYQQRSSGQSNVF